MSRGIALSVNTFAIDDDRAGAALGIPCVGPTARSMNAGIPFADRTFVVNKNIWRGADAWSLNRMRATIAPMAIRRAFGLVHFMSRNWLSHTSSKQWRCVAVGGGGDALHAYGA